MHPQPDGYAAAGIKVKTNMKPLHGKANKFLRTAAVFLAVCILPFAFNACGEKPSLNTEVTVKVIFDLNYEGAPATEPADKTVTVGGKYGALPDPEREGWVFDDWFLRSDGTGGRIRAATTVERNQNHTLYANWVAEPPGVIDPDPPTVEPPKDSPYALPVYPNDVKINIGAWQPFHLDNPQRFADIANAGFTFILPLTDAMNFGDNPSAASAIMNRAEAAGLKVIVSDTDLVYGWNEKNMHLYENHAAFMGVHIIDEPAKLTDYNNSSYCPGSITMTTKRNAFYNRVSADKIFFVNLLPPTVTGSAGDSFYFGMSYENYLKSFLNIGLNMLSYDNYALMNGGSIKSFYLSNLETARNTAKGGGVPLHNFILSVPHKTSSNNYRSPSEAELRWQIAVNCAYGVNAFSYFTYQTPQLTSIPSGETYGDALLSREGVKTPLYALAQKVNREMLAWDHVYLKYAWQKTYAIGSNSLFAPSGHPALANRYASGITSAGVIDGISSLSSTESILAGVFKDGDGNNGYMLTNAANPSETKTAAVTVKFSGAYKGALTYEKGVPNIINLEEDGSAVIGLAPGEGKFIIPLKLKEIPT